MEQWEIFRNCILNLEFKLAFAIFTIIAIKKVFREKNEEQN